MKTTTWHFILYIVIMLVPLIWAYTIRGNWLNPLQWFEAILIDLIITAVYGGIVWW